MLVEVVVLSPGAEIAPARALAVCAGDLASPARADVDPAVFGASTVADHEVIAQAVRPFANATVVVVHALGCVVVVGGVMDDDHFPAAGLDSAARDQFALVERDGGLSVGRLGRCHAWYRRRNDPP